MKFSHDPARFTNRGKRDVGSNREGRKGNQEKKKPKGSSEISNMRRAEKGGGEGFN